MTHIPALTHRHTTRKMHAYMHACVHTYTCRIYNYIYYILYFILLQCLKDDNDACMMSGLIYPQIVQINMRSVVSRVRECQHVPGCVNCYSRWSTGVSPTTGLIGVSMRGHRRRRDHHIDQEIIRLPLHRKRTSPPPPPHTHTHATPPPWGAV